MTWRVPLPRIRITGGDLPDPDELADLQPLLQLLGQQIATYAKGVWMAVSQGEGMRNTGPGSYVGGIAATGNVSIDIDDVSEDSASAHLTVEIENNSPHADIVEDGHGSYHLPSVINWNRIDGSVKWTVKGTPYLSIPFRHAAFASPQERVGYTQATIKRMMPRHIYDMAVKLHRVRKLDVGPVSSLLDRRTGETVEHLGPGGRAHAFGAMASDPERFQARHMAADRYRQPARRSARRLDRSEVQPMIQLGGPGAAGAEGFEERRSARGVPGSGHNPEWGASRYHGMFRTGAAGHSAYMTIRTMTPDSKGWNIPAQLGKGIARRAAADIETSPDLEAMLDQAMAGWLESATGGPG